MRCFAKYDARRRTERARLWSGNAVAPSPHSSQQPHPPQKSGHPGHYTMPQPGTGLHTPKLSSVQPTNVTGGSRPSTAGPSKPPHPQQQAPAPVGSRLHTPDSASGTKGMGTRRHSHDPNEALHHHQQYQHHQHSPAHTHAQQQQYPGQHQHTEHTQSMQRPTVQRVASVGMTPQAQHSYQQHHASHAPPVSGSPAPSASSNSSSGSGSNMRRSSSTSSLAFMVTPEEAASKSLHDRLYEEYRSLSIAALKQRISERMREGRQSGAAAGAGGAADPAPELHGILEKSDLIESLIRLTPKTRPVGSSHSHHPHHGMMGLGSVTSPPRTASPRFDVEYDSAQSTPRIQSGAATPADRSRAQSIDAGNEAALLGTFAIPRTLSSQHVSRTHEREHSREPSREHSAHQHLQQQSHQSSHHPHMSASPSVSPSTSPMPSPTASIRSHVDEHGHTHALHGTSHASSSAHSHQRRAAPLEHSSLFPQGQHHQAHHHEHHGAGVMSPSPMMRSVSSPESEGRSELSYARKHGQPLQPHARESPAMPPMRTGSHPVSMDAPSSSRNFTFGHGGGGAGSAASQSGATSPSSTNSNVSHASSSSGQPRDLDLDDPLYGQHHPSLHVDISGALTPPSISAPTSADVGVSPVQGRYSTGMSQLHPPPSTVHHAMTPQSPSIPEGEEGLGVEQDETMFASSAPHSVSAAAAAAAAAAAPYSSKSAMSSSRHTQQQQPSSQRGPASQDAGVNAPLGARRKPGEQFSASVDDLSRMVPPASQAPVVSARLQHSTPNASPVAGHGSLTGAPQHLRTSTSFHEPNSSFYGSASSSGGVKHSMSAENTPLSSSRTAASFANPQPHNRSSTSLIGGPHPAMSPPPPHDDETEEKKRARLEAAERSRLQKKTDAAKAAKASEDKILMSMSSFTMH